MEMKKWENHFGNAIYLSDSEEEITKKVMSAVTDPNRIKKDDLGNPDICLSLIHIYFSRESGRVRWKYKKRI